MARGRSRAPDPAGLQREDLLPLTGTGRGPARDRLADDRIDRGSPYDRVQSTPILRVARDGFERSSEWPIRLAKICIIS